MASLINRLVTTLGLSLIMTASGSGSSGPLEGPPAELAPHFPAPHSLVVTPPKVRIETLGFPSRIDNAAGASCPNPSRLALVVLV